MIRGLNFLKYYKCIDVIWLHCTVLFKNSKILVNASLPQKTPEFFHFRLAALVNIPVYETLL